MSFLIKLVIIVFTAVGIGVTPFLLSGFFFFVRSVRSGKKLPHRKYPSIWHEHTLFRKLFVDFPASFVHDLFTLNPDAFPMSECGLVIFEGEQGSGKTVSAVYYMDMLRKKYPKLSVMSNVGLSFSDKKLNDWNDIVFTNNGEFGQVVFLDEIQNYFNSLDSKNFPPEMIQEICQQRKQRKTIIGTVQVFNRVAKPIREQTKYIVRPRTFFGCLTIMSIWKPKFDDDAKVEKSFRVKTHIFVHTPLLRDAYDTFEVVERHALTGFKPRSEMLTDNNINILGDTKQKKTIISKR